MPQRLQFKRDEPLPDGAVYVGRPTTFGNPFKIIRTGSSWHVVGPNEHAIACATKEEARLLAVRLYTDWIDQPEQAALRAVIKQKLKGRDVACWCPCDGKPCHGDVLLEISNG